MNNQPEIPGEKRNRKRHYYVPLIILSFVILFALFRSNFIRVDYAPTIELTVALLILIVFIFSLLINFFTLFITLVYSFLKNQSTKAATWKRRLQRQSIFTISTLVLLTIVTIVSQTFAFTPPILDKDGKQVSTSISTIEEVTLNDSEQWISIRGNNKENPVLLFLAGGPGGSQMAATRTQLKELEKHFVIVNWDQPGAGKSYDARDDLTPHRYIDDAHELTLYLQEKFDNDKLYVLGESWGSALGILLVEEYPELYHAFIGTGQMVAFEETETICYELAKKIARKRGDNDKVEQLEKQGPPPYYGNDVVWKESAYLSYLSDEMVKNPDISNPGYNTIEDVSGPEYGLYDKVNYFRGIIYTFNDVYQQLYDIDLRKQGTTIDIPVYFLIGRHDINAPTTLSEEYFNILNAPHKEFIWFEHSGHSPWMNEKEKFVNTVVKILEKETER